MHTAHARIEYSKWDFALRKYRIEKYSFNIFVFETRAECSRRFDARQYAGKCVSLWPLIVMFERRAIGKRNVYNAPECANSNYKQSHQSMSFRLRVDFLFLCLFQCRNANERKRVMFAIVTVYHLRCCTKTWELFRALTINILLLFGSCSTSSAMSVCWTDDKHRPAARSEDSCVVWMCKNGWPSAMENGQQFYCGENSSSNLNS